MYHDYSDPLPEFNEENYEEIRPFGDWYSNNEIFRFAQNTDVPWNTMNPCRSMRVGNVVKDETNNAISICMHIGGDTVSLNKKNDKSETNGLG